MRDSSTANPSRGSGCSSPTARKASSRSTCSDLTPNCLTFEPDGGAILRTDCFLGRISGFWVNRGGDQNSADILGGVTKSPFQKVQLKGQVLIRFSINKRRNILLDIIVLLMEATQQLYFEPCPTIPYKVVSVMDGLKAFTLQEGTNKLILQDYKAAPNQLFNVYIFNNNNQTRYALVNLTTNQALWIEGDNPKDGGVVKSDPGQHPSTFLEIEPVSKGDWAGKACYLKTFSGRALDIKGGKPNPGTQICQWQFHGNANQCWVISPADQLPPPQAQQLPDLPQVPVTNPDTIYKIVSVLDPMMSLTVDKKSNELAVHPYKGTPLQKFSVRTEKGKFAIVVPKTKSALCIFGDKQENSAKAVMDPGQHSSSWFQIVCSDKGLYAKKGYLIKTHADGKALDISGGKPLEGTPVIQYDIHQNGNQLWMLVPVQEPKVAKHKKEEGDVSPKFNPKPKSYYKIVSALDPTKVLTLNPNNLELQVKTFDDEANQKFSIHSENQKFGLVACGTQNGLCVLGDKVANSAKVIADPDKHLSNWFDIVRTEKGPFAYKGYIIKTHAGTMALDISGGKAEDNKPVVQYNIHENGNQVWLFVQVPMPNVPANFKPDANIAYKIVSALDKKKALTVDGQKGEVTIKNFSGNENQKFTIILEKHKFALVTPNKNALCIFGDKQDNLAPLVSDPGKHNSSWFEIARAKDGPLATKGFVIKTHANGKALDITGGQAIEGKPVVQSNLTENGSQVWLIEPFLQEANKPEEVQPGQKDEQSQQGQGFVIDPQHFFGGIGGQGFHWNAQFPNAPNFAHNFGMGFNQQPIVPVVPQVHFAPNQHFIIYAVHGNSLKCIDVAQDMANYGNLILYSFHGAPNQRFVFEQEGPAYRIKSVASGKYVRVTNDDQHDNMWIRTDDKGNKSELWTIVPTTAPQYAGKKAYHIKSIFGKALETPQGKLDNSTKIQQGSFTGSEGQTWIIKEI